MLLWCYWAPPIFVYSSCQRLVLPEPIPFLKIVNISKFGQQTRIFSFWGLSDYSYSKSEFQIQNKMQIYFVLISCQKLKNNINNHFFQSVTYNFIWKGIITISKAVKLQPTHITHECVKASGNKIIRFSVEQHIRYVRR